MVDLKRPGLVVVVCIAVASGCTSPGVSLEELNYDPRLLTGETVFGEPVAAAEAPRARVNARANGRSTASTRVCRATWAIGASPS